MRPSPAPLDAIAASVDRRLAELFDAERARWSAVDADLGQAVDDLARFCRDGGKRLRPAFCYWSYLGAGGDPENPQLVDLCTALETLHAFALLHDDVMDGSATRRGRETTHVRVARQHRQLGWRGDDRRYGEGVAILLGDLAFTYADQLVEPLPRHVRALFTETRVELTMGQFLDLQSAARGDTDLARATRILLHKSAKYTIERPLQMGAALAERLDDRTDALSSYGLAVGEAFQLRDDVLGCFGDEAVVGKPVGDDLREGKATPLLARAIRAADPDQAATLARVGRADLSAADVAEICDVLERTGARAAVEARIDELTDEAIAALAGIELAGDARPALAALAEYVARRQR